MSGVVLCPTEQIKPQHIVGEDSMDNEDEPRKGELRCEFFVRRLQTEIPACSIFQFNVVQKKCGALKWLN